jgi:diguanylate cyclase (GGDEF)-like protein
MTAIDRPLLFGVLLNELEGTYQSVALRGLRAAARRLGVNLLCFPGRGMGAGSGFDREFNVVYQLARDAHLDGMIAFTDTFDWALPPGGFEQFVAGLGHIPTVCIGGSAKAGLSGISTDNRGGMERLVDHFLHDHGYRRIAFIKGIDGNADTRQRYQAYLDRHRAAGVPVDPQLVIEGRFNVYAAGAGVEALLDRGVEFDALISANDEMALAAMGRLTRRDVLVPEHVAVAGYDDVAGQADTPIPLTSVDQDVPGIVARALEHLVDRVRGRAGPMTLTLPARLRLRYSCGCGDEESARRFGRMWVDSQRGEQLMDELGRALADDLREDPPPAPAAPPAPPALPGPPARAGAPRRRDRFGRLLRQRMLGSRGEPGAMVDLRTALRMLSGRVMRDAEQLPQAQERRIIRKLLDAQNALSLQEQALQAEDSLRRHVRSRALWYRTGPAPDARGFRIEQLLGPLQQALLDLGLKTVLMVLYPQPVHAEAWNRFTVPRELTLAMAVIDGRPVPPAQLGSFAAHRFLPVSPFDRQAGIAGAVFPLFLHSQHFGYLVLDIGRDLEQTFEEIRSDVSSLITSTALIGELFRAGDLLREDLSRQRDANRQLSTLARRDDLTGLLNRRGFHERVDELRRGQPPGEAVLLAIDLDGLKQINDQHGHAAGDKALQAAAQVLAAAFRDEDAVARMGGDEFAVFTQPARGDVLPALLQRLQQRLDGHNLASGEPWTVAFSIGSHVLPPGGPDTLDQALVEADRRLYVAKRQRKAAHAAAQMAATATAAAAVARARHSASSRRRPRR